MVLLYIIVLSFFDHVFSFLPATEIDSQWMSTNSRVLWLMQFKKILRMWQSFVMLVPFHFLGLRWFMGVAGLLGCRIFSLAPHGTSFWQRTVCSGMKVNPILGPENEKEDGFPALRYYRLQHPQPIPETCHQLYTMFCYWCNSHSWWILDELKPQLEYHPEKETHLKGCWIRNIPSTTQPILYHLGDKMGFKCNLLLYNHRGIDSDIKSKTSYFCGTIN